MQTLSLTTSDGHVLAADLAEPDGVARGAVVVCHPHPLYGGNRYNNMVDALFGALPPAGFVAIRFDFRDEHDNGVGERLDVVAALDALGDRGLPTFVAGYSFGALVALATTDERVQAIVAIAPPLSTTTPPPAVPTLVLSPSNDQFCPPDLAAPIVATWPDAEARPITGTDHFLSGATASIAATTVAWLGERLGG